jgi:hypothetical protein
MHDPEFEKHVQKKLEELQFNPSGEVWTKVEQEIKKEKRRRPLLWIFLLSGLLLGAGYWLLVTGKNAATVAKNVVIDKEEKKKPVDDNINAAANKNSISQQKNLKENNQPKINKDKANDVTINNKSIAKNNTTIKPKTSSAKKKSLDDKQSVPLFQSKNEKVKREADDAVVDINNISSEKKNDGGINATAKDKENVAADSQINKTGVAKNINSKKSKLLRLGFTGGAGFSDINKMASNLCRSIFGKIIFEKNFNICRIKLSLLFYNNTDGQND